jgi:uncharacterized protein DUF4340
MKMKSLIIIFTITVVVAIAAYFAVKSRSDKSVAEFDTSKLLPELESKLNLVDQIQVMTNKGKFTIKKNDVNWVLIEKSSYPVAIDYVRETLNGLSEFKIIEAKTKKPELFAKLNLNDPSEEGSRAVRMKITAGSDSDTPDVLGDIIIGKKIYEGPKSFYVRHANKDQSWQVAGDFKLRNKPEEWLVDNIIDIDQNRVKGVYFTPPIGTAYSIVRENIKETDYDLNPIPSGKKPKSPYLVKAVAKGLDKLKLQDVAAASSISFGPQPHTIFKLFDGLVIEIYIAKSSEKEWINLKAKIDEDLAEDKEKVQKEADEINARISNWAYYIPSYKMNTLNKSHDALIEPIETKNDKTKK